MDTQNLKQVTLSQYNYGAIQFIDDVVVARSIFFSLVHKQVCLPLMKKEVSIPWIKLNFRVIFRRVPKKKRIHISLEDSIFEKITRISRGNPGVAIHLWESNLKDNTISLNSITDTSRTIDLDISESFLLMIILSMKSLHKKDLATIAGSEMDIRQVLNRLVQQGLVSDDAGYYSIPPFALGPIIEYLKKTRRLW